MSPIEARSADLEVQWPGLLPAHSPSADGRWIPLVDERENFLRHRVRRFPARVLLALRVRVNATWGDKIARIFEVRASDAMM